MADDWYELIGDDTLRQGDLLERCPIMFPPEDVNEVINGEQEIEYGEVDVVVLSQSCDLIADKISIVQVCPYYEIDELEWIKKSNGDKDANKRKESIRRGFVAGYHLLNKCDIESFERNYVAVDFRNTYGVALNFLNNLVQQKENRLRLNSPYREHLSQAFARFFMRVGLPANIPSFG